MSFKLHPNPHFGHGTPDGMRGTILAEGRHPAIRGGWNDQTVWVQFGDDPNEWFECGPLMRATFEATPEVAA